MMASISLLAGADDAVRITVRVDADKVPQPEARTGLMLEAIRAARLLVCAPIAGGLRGEVCDSIGEAVGAWTVTDADEDGDEWFEDGEDA